MGNVAEYTGEIVIAKLVCPVLKDYYQFAVQIETGMLAGQNCLAVHRGQPKFQRGTRMLVRIDEPHFVSNAFPTETHCAYYLTRDVPKDFESTLSDQVLFYAIWENRMKEAFDIPVLGKISNYYDPGFVCSAVHFVYSRGSDFIVPYQIDSKRQPKKIIRDDGNRAGKLRSVSGSIKKLLKSARNNLKKQTPRLITIDEAVDLEERILPEMIATGFQCIELQPHQ